MGMQNPNIKVTPEVGAITPEMAKELLGITGLTGNKPLRPELIDAYVADIKAGLWKIPG